MIDIKGIIQSIGKLNSWKHVVVLLAAIVVGCYYMMRDAPIEVQEYNANGKSQKITKFR
jgi:hypothetical protein